MGLVEGSRPPGRSRSNVTLGRSNSSEISEITSNSREPAQWVPNSPVESATALSEASSPGTVSFVPASRQARKMRMANSNRAMATTTSNVSTRSIDSAGSASYVPRHKERRKGRRKAPTNNQPATSTGISTKDASNIADPERISLSSPAGQSPVLYERSERPALAASDTVEIQAANSQPETFQDESSDNNNSNDEESPPVRSSRILEASSKEFVTARRSGASSKEFLSEKFDETEGSLREKPETLLEAELVEDNLVMAEPLAFDDFKNNNGDSRGQYRKWLLIGGGVLLLALVLIGGLVGALVGGRSSSTTVIVEGNKEESKENISNVAIPTGAPSTAEASDGIPIVEVTATKEPATEVPTEEASSPPPTNASDNIPNLTAAIAEATFLPEFSVQTVRNNSSSSQAQALLWLQQHPHYNNNTLMPDWRKLQLMALATLFFETDGDGSLLPRPGRGGRDGPNHTETNTRRLAASSNTTWLDMESNECDWEFDREARQVDACSPDGQYKTLNLQGQKLRGTIPPELSFLTLLGALDFGGNRMKGRLPTEIGLLTLLTKLDFFDNRISGPLPSELGGLTALAKLVLNQNLMTSSLPTEMGQMAALRELWLSNDFSGTIPSELGLLTLLNVLDLSSNQLLSGTLPIEVASIPTLKRAWLDDNNLTGVLPPELFELSGLESLALQGNNFTGNVTLDMCSDLKELKVDCDKVDCSCDLCGCSDETKVPAPDSTPTEMPTVETIPPTTDGTVSPTMVPTTMPTKETAMPTGGTTTPTLSSTGAPVQDSFLPEYTLQTIAEGSESPQAKALAWLEQHPDYSSMVEWRKLQLMGLATFYFSTAGEYYPYPSDVAQWLNTTANECEWAWIECHEDKRLRSLRPPDNILRGSIPPEMSFLEKLVVLEIFANGKLTGSIPTEMGLMTDLGVLRLKWTSITGTIPSELGLASIGWLELVAISLSGSIPSELGLWTSCGVFDVRDNKLTGTLPTELGLMTPLTSLNVQENMLVGSIPTEFGMMTAMHWFWLWDNNLSGSIPSELGALTANKEFVAHNNQLVGTIPSEIGGMRFLTALDLGANLLTGPIPGEIGRNIDLVRLSLSGNSLTGTIPSAVCSLPDLDSLELDCDSMDDCNCP